MFGSGGGGGGSGGQLYDYSEEEEDLGKVYDRVLMQRLLAYLKPYWLEVALIVLLMIGYSHLKYCCPI